MLILTLNWNFSAVCIQLQNTIYDRCLVTHLGHLRGQGKAPRAVNATLLF